MGSQQREVSGQTPNIRYANQSVKGQRPIVDASSTGPTGNRVGRLGPHFSDALTDDSFIALPAQLQSHLLYHAAVPAHQCAGVIQCVNGSGEFLSSRHGQQSAPASAGVSPYER